MRNVLVSAAEKAAEFGLEWLLVYSTPLAAIGITAYLLWQAAREPRGVRRPLQFGMVAFLVCGLTFAAIGDESRLRPQWCASWPSHA